MVKWKQSDKGFYAELTSYINCLVLEVEPYCLDGDKIDGTHYTDHYMASAFYLFSTEKFSTPEDAKKCAENMARELLSEALANLGDDI